MKSFIKTLYILCAIFFLAVGGMAMLYAVADGATAIGCGLIMLVLLPCGRRLRRKWPRLHAFLSRMVALMFILALSACIVASIQILSCYTDDEAPQDAVMIVLGCGLSSTDQTSPSVMMQKRLDAALIYLIDHPETKCIVSGGQGPDEKITEAQAMYTYLISQGISEDRLYKEEASTNTEENIAFSKELALDEGLISSGVENHLIIVTDGFHEFRAHQIGEKHGFSCYTVASYAPISLVCLYWLREIPGIILQVWL